MPKNTTSPDHSASGNSGEGSGDSFGRGSGNGTDIEALSGSVNSNTHQPSVLMIMLNTLIKFRTTSLDHKPPTLLCPPWQKLGTLAL